MLHRRHQGFGKTFHPTISTGTRGLVAAVGSPMRRVRALALDHMEFSMEAWFLGLWSVVDRGPSSKTSIWPTTVMVHDARSASAARYWCRFRFSRGLSSGCQLPAAMLRIAVAGVCEVAWDGLGEQKAGVACGSWFVVACHRRRSVLIIINIKASTKPTVVCRAARPQAQRTERPALTLFLDVRLRPSQVRPFACNTIDGA